MAITKTDIKWYKALVNNDGTSNGGRRGPTSSYEVTMGTANCLFPDVENEDRIAGITRCRKSFIQNYKYPNETFRSAYLGIDIDSTSDNYMRIALGTATDTQASIGSKVFVGTGLLDSAVLTGAVSVDVDFQDTDLNGVLVAGMKLYITSLVNCEETGASGRYSERNEIDVAGVTWAGSVATIPLVTALQHDYNTSYTVEDETVYTRIAVLVSLGDIEATVGTAVVTSTAGTVDEDDNPIQVDNRGTVTDTITITFSSATAYSISGAYLGSLGTGSTLALKNVSNPNMSGTNYFSIPVAFWGGTWASGDTVVFTVTASNSFVWVKEETPAGTTAEETNTTSFVLLGQS